MADTYRFGDTTVAKLHSASLIRRRSSSFVIWPMIDTCAPVATAGECLASLLKQGGMPPCSRG
jgi:hypothetical protein